MLPAVNEHSQDRAPIPQSLLSPLNSRDVPAAFLQETWRRVHEGDPLARKEEDEMQRSLQLSNDERYQMMHRFRNQSSDGHFANLRKQARRMNSVDKEKLTEDQKVKEEFVEIAMRNLSGTESYEAKAREAAVNVSQRIHWQEQFERSINRLLQDFELSDVPSCRLNHLDRMHQWFEEQGGKQVRMGQPGPSYLTADPSERPLPGSTRDLPNKHAGSLSLAGAYSIGVPTPRRR